MLCPYESGMQILRVSEIEFMRRLLDDPSNGWSEVTAKNFHVSLWKLFIDARTKERKKKLNRGKNARKKEYTKHDWRILHSNKENREHSERLE